MRFLLGFLPDDVSAIKSVMESDESATVEMCKIVKSRVDNGVKF